MANVTNNDRYAELSNEVAALVTNQANLQREIGSVTETVKTLSDSVQKGFEHLGQRIDSRGKPQFTLIITALVALVGIIGVYISNSTGPIDRSLEALKEASLSHFATLDRSILRQEDSEAKNRELVMANVERTIQDQTFIALFKDGLINIPKEPKSVSTLGHGYSNDQQIK